MTGHCLRIAVVDDEESVRKALKRLLHSAGFEVITYGSGKEFLESLQVEAPDCIVLDLHLPGLTGLDVLVRLKEEGIRVPAVIITGYDEPGVREKALAAGAAAYLLKPIDDEKLIANVIECAKKARTT